MNDESPKLAPRDAEQLESIRRGQAAVAEARAKREAHGHAVRDAVRLSAASGVVSATDVERSKGRVVAVEGHVLVVEHADGTTSRLDAATVERAPRP